MSTRNKRRKALENAETVRIVETEEVYTDQEEELDDKAYLRLSGAWEYCSCVDNTQFPVTLKVCWECRKKVCSRCILHNKNETGSDRRTFQLKGFNDKYMNLCIECVEYLQYKHNKYPEEFIPPPFRK